jgi:hypothetical protein
VESETSYEIVSKANGLLKAASNFEFVLNLVIMEDILSKTFITSKALQMESAELAAAFSVLDSCLTQLDGMRNENTFEKFIC